MRALLERYETYRQVLEEAGQAIARRDETSLAGLEAESAGLLADIQRLWHDETDDPPVCERELLPALQAAMSDALVQIAANQAALAEWLQGTGASIQLFNRGKTATQGYASGSGIEPAWLRLNA